MMLRASLSMFACLQWCLIDAFGGFDHYPTGRNLAILGVPLAANSEERCWWLEWGIVSGVVTGAPFAALNVELAIGTCRHHLPMVRVEASSFTDQAASTRSYSASHRHSDLLPVVRVKATIIGARVAFTRYATIH